MTSGPTWTSYTNPQTGAAEYPSEEDIYGTWHAYTGQAGFSYLLPELELDQLYRVEIDYPDDDRRDITFQLKAATYEDYDYCNHKSNPFLGGVASGDEYGLSDTMITHEAYVRLNATDTAPYLLSVVSGITGYEAGISAIRVYRIDSALTEGAEGSEGGRSFGYYFEETLTTGHWYEHFGGDPDAPTIEAQIETLHNWAEMNRFMGANVMMPTVSGYGGNLYSSSVLVGMQNKSIDYMRLGALIADSYGQTYIPELMPETSYYFDETEMGVWEENGVMQFATDAARDYVMYDSSGNLSYNGYSCIFNPLNPQVQDVFISMIREVADRISDADSFAGVASRLMLDWHWRGFNGLPGLEYGYGDGTIAAFEADTQIDVPGPVEGDFGDRLPDAV